MNQNPDKLPGRTSIVRIPFTKSFPGSYSAQKNQLPCFYFPYLSENKYLVHYILTRYGGSSSEPYDTLNTGYNTGDNPSNVDKNLKLIKDLLGAEQLIFVDQVHKDNIIVLKSGTPVNSSEVLEADAIITDMPHVAVMVKQADCQGIILFDPVKTVVAVVHCGWKGNRCNISGKAVRLMRAEFGCSESDIRAAIGPSLGPCCGEFLSYKDIFPEDFKQFMVRENYFDLWGLSRWQLINAGLKKENIEAAEICTKCNSDMFFSYRAKADTGRFATVAMIQDK